MTTELLTTSEVAALCGVKPDAVRRWDANGKLKAATRTLGGHRRWRRDQVEAFQARRPVRRPASGEPVVNTVYVAEPSPLAIVRQLRVQLVTQQYRWLTVPVIDVPRRSIPMCSPCLDFDDCRGCLGGGCCCACQDEPLPGLPAEPRAA